MITATVNGKVVVLQVVDQGIAVRLELKADTTVVWAKSWNLVDVTEPKVVAEFGGYVGFISSLLTEINAAFAKHFGGAKPKTIPGLLTEALQSFEITSAGIVKK